MGERLTFTFALTGRRVWGHGTQGVALGSELAGLSARAGPQTELFTHNLPPPLNIPILNTQPVMAKAWANDLLLLLPPRKVDFVIYSRPRIVLPPSASSATTGRESCYHRPRIDDFL